MEWDRYTEAQTEKLSQHVKKDQPKSIGRTMVFAARYQMYQVGVGTRCGLGWYCLVK